MAAGFFSFLGFPRLQSDDMVRKAIARGVETGLFGYATGRPELGDDGRYRLDRSRVAFQRAVADDEIDLDSGFLIVPAALPESPAASTGSTGGDAPGETGGYPEPGGTGAVREKADAGDWRPSPGDKLGELTISFTADRDKLFDAWKAHANPADVAGKVSVSVEAKSDTAFDRSRLENGVLGPLRELGLIHDSET